MSFKLIMATHNQGKIKELELLLQGLPVEIISFRNYPELPEVEEDGDTFLENACKKALETARRTGIVAIADDSGLEVDALQGQPGVYSARFAGEPKNDQRNNEKLLELLQDIPGEKRTGRFVSVIAIATPEGQVYTAEGKCEGLILSSLQGTGGFGYDPLFYLPEVDKTFAQLSLTEKNRLSHRGQALGKALPILEKLVKG